jgi:hypothetical protein
VAQAKALDPFGCFHHHFALLFDGREGVVTFAMITSSSVFGMSPQQTNRTHVSVCYAGTQPTPVHRERPRPGEHRLRPSSDFESCV